MKIYKQEQTIDTHINKTKTVKMDHKKLVEKTMN